MPPDRFTKFSEGRRMSNRNWNVAVVGLGYVGLPLAIEFGKRFQTIGFDVSEAKIASYREGRDAMGEVPHADLPPAATLNSRRTAALLRERRSFSSPSRHPSTRRASRICDH